MRSLSEEIARIIKDATGGLSLVMFEISGYNLTVNIRFFSTAICLLNKNRGLIMLSSMNQQTALNPNYCLKYTQTHNIYIVSEAIKLMK